MQVIANRNTSIIDKCISLRKTFDAADAGSKLYDINYNNKKAKVQDLWNQIDESIVSFWHDNTEPDPSPYKQVFIKLNDGTKEKHPIHYLRGTKQDFYDAYCIHPSTILLFREIDMKLPSYWYFDSKVPKYVKFIKKVEYTDCATHYNFKQMWECFVSMIKKLCYCGTKDCDYYDEVFDQCWCYECGECDMPNLLNFSFSQLLDRVCCEHENEFTWEKCICGKC